MWLTHRNVHIGLQPESDSFALAAQKGSYIEWKGPLSWHLNSYHSAPCRVQNAIATVCGGLEVKSLGFELMLFCRELQNSEGEDLC